MVKRYPQQYFIALVCAVLFFCNPARAAVDPSPGIAKSHAAVPITIPPQDIKAPATIKAEKMVYNPQTHEVSAEGHVEINQDKRILFADKVIYNQETDVADAVGHVVVLEPSGQVYFADKVRLNNELKVGVIKDFKAIMVDKSRFAANTATRVSDTITKLEQAVYSPCQVCKDNPNQAPLWQIKADKVKISEDSQSIMYHDAEMDVYGIPVLYTPFFSHPTPNSDNESGFLTPLYRNSSVFGPSVQVPYYFAIAPNMDLTLTPIFNSNYGDVLTGEFRHLTETGGYKIKASITDPQKLDDAGNPVPGNQIRGHIEGVGKFDLDDDWAWGFSGKRATDDTYLSRYHFGGETNLTSTAYINQIKNRDFIEIRGLTFQGLSVGNDPATTPLVLPMTQTHFESAPGYLGSRLTLDTNTNVVYRETGPQSRRASVTGAYNLPVITPSGSLFDFTAKMRGDIYSVENVG